MGGALATLWIYKGNPGYRVTDAALFHSYEAKRSILRVLLQPDLLLS